MGFLSFILLIKSLKNRIKNNYQSDLVGIFCLLGLGSIFAYIFDDFLKNHLAGLPSNELENIQNLFFALFTGLVQIFVLYNAHQQRINPWSIFSFISNFGQNSNKILGYLIQYHILNFICFTLPAFIVFKSIFFPSEIFAFRLFISFILITILFLFFKPKRSEPLLIHKNFEIKSEEKRFSKIKILTRWRCYQMLILKKSNLILLTLCVLLSLLQGFLRFKNYPLLIQILLGLSVSMVLVYMISSQVKEDRQTLWMDKIFGVSEEEYSSMLSLLCICFGGAFFVFNCLVLFSAQYLTNSFDLVHCFKLALIVFMGPWLLPRVVFQIDPNKISFSFFSVFLLNLFFSTAIMIHLGFVLLPILLNSYSKKSQLNRFYTEG